MLRGLKGRLGNIVMVSDGDDLILRERPGRYLPQEASQVAAQSRQTSGAKLWKNLPVEAAEAWRRYAVRNPLPPKPNGRPGSTRGDNVFGSFATRYLLVHPGSTPPARPPESAFFGDSIGVRLAAVTLTLPSPEGEGASEMRIVADGPNAPGVVTQILLQPLVSRNRRTYATKYVHEAIVTFTAEVREVTLPMATPWVAVAYRFIRADTGQATALAEIGIARAD